MTNFCPPTVCELASEKMDIPESLTVNTVNFLNIRTPKKLVVITLTFELCGSNIE